MVKPKIKTSGKKLLRSSSRDEMGSYFQSLSLSERKKKWLHRSNRYRQNCTHKYRQDHPSGTRPSRISHEAMRAYIAASAPGHVIDGWSFLGRAIDALLLNDVYTAVHIGYYSELRAAMGLLAAEGVGILDSQHPVCDKNGDVHDLPKMDFWDPSKFSGSGGFAGRRAGTHAVVWPCLNHWTGLSKSFDLVNELFQPAGHGLDQWLSSLGSRVPAKLVTQKWISIWGLDLAQPENDRDSRNMASYRPSIFRPPEIPELEDTLEFVDQVWRCFEPSSYGTFPLIEKHLLRRALQAAEISLPLEEGRLGRIGITGGEEAAWLSVLNSENEPLLFSEAECTSEIDETRCHIQVISRAALLLNLATAAARRHLVKAGYDDNDLRFWWHNYGCERGFWAESDSVNPIDLWADMGECLKDLNEWRSTNGGTELFELRRNQRLSREMLGAFELVGIWGLIP